MTLLARKSWRQLRAQRGQGLAVFAVMALGVMLFVASAGAYLDLRQSYAETKRTLALAAWHVDVAPLAPGDVARLASLPDVGALEPRVVTQVPVMLAKRSDRVDLRLISLPDRGEPSLDRVLVVEGALPNAGEVLLEKHFARHHGLAPGATVHVELAGVTRELRVSGVAVAAQYLWVSRSEDDPMPSPDTFGVGWMRRSALHELAAPLATAVGPDAPEDLRVAATADESNELLASGSRAGAALQSALGPRDRRAVDAAHLTGPRLLQMDVDGYEGMATFFPIFFLGVGVFIVASIVSRLVDAERAIIGTFLAIGVGARRILAHYLGHAVALGGLGALAGALLGFAVTRPMTHEYAGELGIPFVVAAPHFGLAAAGIAMGVASAALAGFLPAWRAAHLAPAAAMRPPVPKIGALARGLRALPSSMVVRMGLREVASRPLRSLGTAFGIAAALVLVMTSGALLDSMTAVVHAIFHDARRFDVGVELVAPVPEDVALERAKKVAGVARAEASLVLPAHVSAHGRTQAIVARGLPPGAELLRSVDADGRVVEPAAGGIVLTRALADSLDVSRGDAVELDTSPVGGKRTLRVSGFADATLGKTATTRLADLESIADLPGEIDSLALVAAPGRLDDVRAAASKNQAVARVDDVAATREIVESAMGFGWVMLAAMLFFSVALAGAILYNTATLGVVERAREIATLRALGRSFREIAGAVTLENAILCVLGVGIGLPLAILSIHEVLALYSGELFAFPFVLSARTVGASIAGVVFVLFASEWPALRQVSRSNLADAVRERA